MAKQQRILVVIDPTATAQPALERATSLAKLADAQVQLLICDYDGELKESRALGHEAVAHARRALTESRLQRLNDLAKPLRAKGIDAAVDARWDHPLYHGVVVKAAEWGADLVVKDTHYHSALERTIFTNTDWSLIRQCPAALMLVKPRPIAAKPRVLAAIDPLHERDAAKSLDKKILATASALCATTGGELHVFHAFDITPVIAASTEAMMMPMALPIVEITDAMNAEHTAAVHELTDGLKLPRERVHIVQGGAREQLLTLTDRLRADVVVMGAVSRSGLERLFIGSTAEEVLDRVPCDLLIVKADGFKPTL
jgi:universal stress protein E